VPADSSRLASRLKDLLRSSVTPGAGPSMVPPLEVDAEAAAPSVERRDGDDDEVPLAGDLAAGCVVMERYYRFDQLHGTLRVGHYAEAVEGCLSTLAVLGGDQRAVVEAGRARVPRLRFEPDRAVADEAPRSDAPTRGPLLFFDLETTGLSGGAGTMAFLVGCGAFDDAGFRVVQYFLSGYHAERDLLATLATVAEQYGGLVSFNGRTFDVPLIQTRYQFHRLPSPFGEMAHFDMLHPARRLWKRRGEAGSGRGPDHRPDHLEPSSCSLGALEEAILGVHRVGDVPGAEIPARYFQFLRTRDVRPLQPVFEHNRLDLLSLAALTAVGMRIIDGGVDAVSSPHEAIAVGQMFERLGRSAEAEAHFERAATLAWPAQSTPSPGREVRADVRAEALCRLAEHRRRQHRHGAAAEAWSGVLEASPGQVLAQQARRALAIHHEHRARDLDAARSLVVGALEVERDPAEIDALRHRLARLDRKRQAGSGAAPRHRECGGTSRP